MSEHDRPVLILTIANGAGHISVAEGLAAAVRATRPDAPVVVVDVADYMDALTRFTHVTAYLWAVKHGVAPVYPQVFPTVIDPSLQTGASP